MGGPKPAAQSFAQNPRPTKPAEVVRQGRGGYFGENRTSNYGAGGPSPLYDGMSRNVFLAQGRNR